MAACLDFAPRRVVGFTLVDVLDGKMRERTLDKGIGQPACRGARSEISARNQASGRQL